MDYRDLTQNDIVKYYIAGCYEPNTWCSSMLLHGCSSSVDMSMVDNQYVEFSSRLLLLSADIELNPGPISDSESNILEAITASENRVLGEIRDVKQEIMSPN